MEVFETFLRKELADENIMFYKAVNEYKVRHCEERSDELGVRYLRE